MLWLRKSKKGFTLIELMVVVAIIGVLSLLGLRLYTGQQDKAKNAIIKANCGTIQTLIQAELADSSYTALATQDAIDAIFVKSGIHDPVNGGTQVTNAETPTSGLVTVTFSNNSFSINGKNAEDDDDVYGTPLVANP